MTQARTIVLPLTVQQELRAVLDAPLAAALDASRCLCADCKRLRAEPFTCHLCGYSGEPSVWACGCPEQFERWAAMTRAVLARRPSEEDEAMLVHYEEGVRRGYHKVGDDQCESCHGHRECPVCDTPTNADAVRAYGVIRAVRHILAARGLL